MPAGERTESATPRRREEVRSRGQVARSADVNSSVAPLAGFGRLFSTRSLVELVKSLLKLAIVGFVAYRTVADRLPMLLVLPAMEWQAGVGLVIGIVFDLAIWTSGALLALALIDYGYQR